MTRWWNPWREIVRLRDQLAAARHLAECWQGRARAYSWALEAVRREADSYRIERDEAWAKLARRSRGISKGNRERALRRRGSLLPEIIEPAHLGEMRNTSTG